MTEHHSLGIAGSATSVDQTATHARLLLHHFLLNDLVLHILAQLQEVLPHKVSRVVDLWRKLVDTVNHNRLHIGQLVQVCLVLLQLSY